MKFEDAMTIMRKGGKGPLCLANGMPSSKRVYYVSNVMSENIVSEDWEEVLTDTEKVIREVEAWSDNGH